MPDEITFAELRAYRVVDSGILAISTLGIAESLQIQSIVYPLNISIYAFSVSMSVAGVHAVMITLIETFKGSEEVRNPDPWGERTHWILPTIATIFFFIGISHMIAYLSFWASLVFLALSVAGYALLLFGVHKVVPAYTRKYIGMGILFVLCIGGVQLLGLFPTQPYYDWLHQLP